MSEVIELGAGPCNEQTAQTTWSDFSSINKAEIRTWQEQLVRELGVPPEGCRFTTVVNRHDFGTYCELGLRIDDEASRACFDYLSLCENSSPEWDEQSLKDLVARLRVVEELEIVLTGDPDFRELLGRFYGLMNRRK